MKKECFRIPSRGLSFGLLLLAARLCAAGEAGTISNVSVSRPFFNPTLGQRIGISFSTTNPGRLTIAILDRDGFLARKLVTERAVEAGELSFEWDGRGDGGDLVPDEAYSLKIDLVSESGIESYFPALAPPEDVSVKTNYYDRQGATLSYQLPRASRIHIQAGVAQIDSATTRPDGPVLRTLVNREPRPAGAVVENWNGSDEGRTFYVPDLPDFVVSIAGTSLPDNAIITIGNRKKTFLESALTRTGASLLPPSAGGHQHHRGLRALEDVAPTLKATPLDAVWSATERVWRPSGKKVRLSFSLTGPSADSFQREPGELYVFVDRQRVLEVLRPSSGGTVQVPLGRLASGAHIVALNWVSAYGPVAVDSLRIKIGETETSRSALRR